MSDEERLKQLTELAQRVWPDLEKPKVDAIDESGAFRAGLEDDGMDYIHIHPHPRALDALEAALLVLAGERPTVNEWAARLAADSVAAGEAEYGRPHAPPAWVEQLAQEWEARAKKQTRETAKKFGPAASAMGPVLEALVSGMATELRERARGRQ